MELNLGDKFNLINHPIKRVAMWTDLDQQKAALSQYRSVWATDCIEQWGLKKLVFIEYSRKWIHLEPYGQSNLLFGLTQGKSEDLYTSSDSTGVTFYPLTYADTPLSFLRSTRMCTVWHELCHMIIPEIYQGEGIHGRCAISVDWMERRIDTINRLHELAGFIHQILTAIDNDYASVSDYLDDLEERRFHGS